MALRETLDKEIENMLAMGSSNILQLLRQEFVECDPGQ